jgi:antitoxin HicB
MKYHFRIHDRDGFWAECVELKGCLTQGKTREELSRNMKVALNLYLDEPENSAMVFPFPSPRVSGAGIVAVEVEPAVAFSMQLRQLRIRHKLTQREAASRIGMRNLYSYQRLERRSNPSLATIKKVKGLFPQFSLDSVLGD